VSLVASAIRRLNSADESPGGTTFDYLEVAFQVIFVVIVAACWISFTLAELGVDRPLVVLVLSGAGLAVALPCILCRRWRGFGWSELLGFLLPIAIGLALFFPPDEWILGALDPGSYVNTGAIIARTGKILAPDPFVATMDPAIRTPLFPYPASRLPGIYLTALRFRGLIPDGFTVETDHVVPHGFHFYPTALAFGYAVGGVWPELYVTPILAVAGLAAMFLLWRRLFGTPVATVAACFLALSPAEVWFARYPDAEILSQLLLLGGLLAFVLTVDSGSKWTALAAGFGLGAVHLTKIEALPLPFLIGAYLGREAISGRWRREWFWFLVPYIVLLCQATVHAVLISSWYTATSFGKTVSRLELLLVGAALSLVLCASLLAFGVPALRRMARRVVLAHAWSTFGNAIVPTTVAVLALYGFFVRPLSAVGVPNPSTDMTQLQAMNDADSFVRLGWYVTPLGLLLGTLGWVVLIRDARSRRTGLVLLVMAVDSLIYLQHMHITPVHYWAARRWVPLVIPGFCVATAYALARLWPTAFKPRIDALFPLGFGLAVVLELYRATTPLIGYVEYSGAVSQLSDLAGRLPENAIVLFAEGDSGERFSTPLNYLFGRTSIVVWPTEDAYAAVRIGARQWQSQAIPVYWINTPDLPGPDKAGLTGHVVFRQNIALAEKLATRDAPPGPDGLFQQTVDVWMLDP
jgi:hypothetical protein